MITVWLGDRIAIELGPWYGPLAISRNPWSTLLSAGPLQLRRWKDSPASLPQETTCAFHETIGRC